jgi:hypothetical protein
LIVVPSRQREEIKLDGNKFYIQEMTADFIDKINKGVIEGGDIDIISNNSNLKEKDIKGLSIKQISFISNQIYKLSFGEHEEGTESEKK